MKEILLEELDKWQQYSENEVIANHPTLPHFYAGGIFALLELQDKIALASLLGCSTTRESETVEKL